MDGDHEQATAESLARSESTEAPETAAAVVVEDLLVEDVSIDGMCGVY